MQLTSLFFLLEFLFCACARFPWIPRRRSRKKKSWKLPLSLFRRLPPTLWFYVYKNQLEPKAKVLLLCLGLALPLSLSRSQCGNSHVWRTRIYNSQNKACVWFISPIAVVVALVAADVSPDRSLVLRELFQHISEHAHTRDAERIWRFIYFYFFPLFLLYLFPCYSPSILRYFLFPIFTHTELLAQSSHARNKRKLSQTETETTTINCNSYYTHTHTISHRVYTHMYWGSTGHSVLLLFFRLPLLISPCFCLCSNSMTQRYLSTLC